MTHQAPVPRARAGRASPHRTAIEIGGVRLTHPDRLLYADGGQGEGPGEGLTKRGLAEYYAVVADRILPHLVGRPLSLVRCPAGQGGKCFFQRHAGAGVPGGVKQLSVAERDGEAIYLAVDDLAGLISLVQIGVLEIHPWGARADDPERPDRLIFDLDPAEGLSWDRVVEAALELRARLTALGLESVVKTTGGKGLHVVLPLARRQDWEEARGFARAVAEAMARDRPSAFTSAAAKAARPGKVFIDYLRNAHGASAIAPYSTRARPGAPVATPLAWAELEQSALRPGDFTVATLPRRLSGFGRDPWGRDPWEGLSKIRQSITRRAQRAVGLSA